jgi:hypothetical protein
MWLIIYHKLSNFDTNLLRNSSTLTEKCYWNKRAIRKHSMISTAQENMKMIVLTLQVSPPRWNNYHCTKYLWFYLFIVSVTTQSVAVIIVYCRVTGRLVNCKFKRTRQGMDVEQLEALKRPRKVINISGRTVIIQVKNPTTSHESHRFRQFAQHTENNCNARAETLQWIRSCLWFPVTLAQAQQRLLHV